MSDTKQRTNAYPQPPFPEQPQTPPATQNTSVLKQAGDLIRGK